MKHSKAFGCAAAILFSTLWAVPLVRAVSFLRYASQAYDGTMNAYQDVEFSRYILASYLVSLCLDLFLAGLVFRRAGLAFVLPVSVLVWKIVEVIRVHPEEVIVLIPTIDPVRFAALHFIIVAVVALLPTSHFSHTLRGTPNHAHSSERPSTVAELEVVSPSNPCPARKKT